VAEATRGESTEDWNQRGSVDEILPYYDTCEIDFIDVQKMLTEAREVFLFPLIDHDPLDSWVDGRVVLVGDAAHAMYPRGGNGACQAIVDTRVVAEKLGTVSDPHEALLAFEAERLEGVNRIVLANRGEGYEVIRRMVAEATRGESTEDWNQRGSVDEILPYYDTCEID
ncbi:FAD-dependent monooxygenase, partial [Streptomyces exfoliatus]|uniref:FAD-dependent monooxygenase n=1 Tax=Streptomyces exfoliatus TaxID=1905 RepID=UPI0004CAC98F